MGVKPPNPPLWVRHALPIPQGREGTGEKERRREERIKGSISDIVTYNTSLYNPCTLTSI